MKYQSRSGLDRQNLDFSLETNRNMIAMQQDWNRLTKTAIHWSLFVITLLYLVTGLGITQYQIVESLTFGLLTKNMAFRVHDSLLNPFVALLVLHVIMRPASWLYSRLKRDSEPRTTTDIR